MRLHNRSAHTSSGGLVLMFRVFAAHSGEIINTENLTKLDFVEYFWNWLKEWKYEFWHCLTNEPVKVSQLWYNSWMKCNQTWHSTYYPVKIQYLLPTFSGLGRISLHHHQQCILLQWLLIFLYEQRKSYQVEIRFTQQYLSFTKYWKTKKGI